MAGKKKKKKSSKSLKLGDQNDVSVYDSDEWGRGWRGETGKEDDEIKFSILF